MSTHVTPTLVTSLDRALAFHVRLRETMSTLDAGFLAANVSPRLSAPWRHFREGMAEHLQVEEEILFPALRAISEGRDPGRVDFETPLQEMQFEVDELATICDALRSASSEAGSLEPLLLDMLDQLDVPAARAAVSIFPEGARVVARWKSGVPEPLPEPAPVEPPPAAHRAAPERPSVLFRVLRGFARRAR